MKLFSSERLRTVSMMCFLALDMINKLDQFGQRRGNNFITLHDYAETNYKASFGFATLILKIEDDYNRRRNKSTHSTNIMNKREGNMR